MRLRTHGALTLHSNEQCALTAVFDRHLSTCERICKMDRGRNSQHKHADFDDACVLFMRSTLLLTAAAMLASPCICTSYSNPRLTLFPPWSPQRGLGFWTRPESPFRPSVAGPALPPTPQPHGPPVSARDRCTPQTGARGVHTRANERRYHCRHGQTALRLHLDARPWDHGQSDEGYGSKTRTRLVPLPSGLAKTTSQMCVA